MALTMIFIFQFEAMKKYLEAGGSILVMMNEGGEIKYNTNINFFLEEYGVMVNTGNNSSCCLNQYT